MGGKGNEIKRNPRKPSMYAGFEEDGMDETTV
jgi:hypothetical protein